MGTAILLKGADFSTSGFKPNVTVLNYMNLVGTAWQANTTFMYNGSLYYRGFFLVETAGATFNKITFKIASNPNSKNLVLAKFNSTSKTWTTIKTIDSSQVVLGATLEVLLDSPVTLASNEYLLFTSDSVDANGPTIDGVSGQEEVYRYNFIYADGNSPSSHNDTVAPHVKVEMVYD